MKHFDRAFLILVCSYVIWFFCHDGTVPFSDMNADPGSAQITNFQNYGGCLKSSVLQQVFLFYHFCLIKVYLKIYHMLTF